MNNFHEACKMLVNKFCKDPSWPREIKCAKKLLQLSPDIDAWMGIELGFKVNSLCYFLGDGAEYVPTSQRNPYLLDFTPTPKKSKPKKGKKVGVSELKDKIEEDLKEIVATKSMFEFLS
jgi:hypothetical protein